VSAQRRFLEDFRLRHNVVSMEREENQVLARVRGQAAALNNANEKLAAAEGKLRSLSEAAAAGRSIVRARDNPTLANLEQRASQLREDLSELERNFMRLPCRAQGSGKRASASPTSSSRSCRRKAAVSSRQPREGERPRTPNASSKQMVDIASAQAFTLRFNEHKCADDSRNSSRCIATRCKA
jgi:hypothetical protein